MRKEVFIIFLLGITLGSIIAYGAWRANSALNQKPYSTSFTTPIEPTTVTKSGQNSENLGLTIAKPENYDVSISDELAISGLSTPNSKVIISDENKDEIIDSDNQGGFENTLELDAGINRVMVSSIGNDGKKIDKSLVLIYSSEFSSSLLEKADSTQTDSTASIDLKVEEKLALARKSPKGLLGTITGKTNNSLQIKNIEGAIDLISVTEATTYGKVGKTTTTAKYDDLAIGDFVVAMGVKNVSGVFESLRILITDPLQESDRQIFSGVVKEIVSKKMTLTKEDGTDLTFTFPSRWTGPELKEFEEGQAVIGVAIEDAKAVLNIRTIDLLNSTLDTSEIQ